MTPGAAVAARMGVEPHVAREILERGGVACFALTQRRWSASTAAVAAFFARLEQEARERVAKAKARC
jgi:hypothetical protein